MLLTYNAKVKPSDIRHTLNSAKLLNNTATNSQAESLLLAYVAWEGLKNRIVISGLSQQGWQLKTFRQAIQGRNFWKAESYNSAFKSVFGSEPFQSPGVGQIWEKAGVAEKLRGKFVHGLGKNTPAVLDASFVFLVETITDLKWLHKLQVQLPSGAKEPLKDIYGVLRSTHGLQIDQSVERLRKQLELNKNLIKSCRCSQPLEKLHNE